MPSREKKRNRSKPHRGNNKDHTHRPEQSRSKFTKQHRATEHNVVRNLYPTCLYHEVLALKLGKFTSAAETNRLSAEASASSCNDRTARDDNRFGFHCTPELLVIPRNLSPPGSPPTNTMSEGHQACPPWPPNPQTWKPGMSSGSSQGTPRSNHQAEGRQVRASSAPRGKLKPPTPMDTSGSPSKRRHDTSPQHPIVTEPSSDEEPATKNKFQRPNQRNKKLQHNKPGSPHNRQRPKSRRH